MSSRQSFFKQSDSGAGHNKASVRACEKVRDLGGVDFTQDWLVYNTAKEDHKLELQMHLRCFQPLEALCPRHW